MMDYAPVMIKVWGEWACYTRPEMKVERVSYEVMTPSAARGVLEAVFWKPEFAYMIREIRVLKPVKFFSILRNEVNSRAVYATARKRIEQGGTNFAEDDRAQRHTLALRDVAYVIAADVQVRPGVAEDPAKFRDQFRRRVARGQCYHAPYLGCREFAAHFSEPDDTEQPIERSADLGLMLHDLAYATDGRGRSIPYFFAARLERGVVVVPPRPVFQEAQ